MKESLENFINMFTFIKIKEWRQNAKIIYSTNRTIFRCMKLCLFIHALIHSFIQQMLSICYMSGTVLSTGNGRIKVWYPAFKELIVNYIQFNSPFLDSFFEFNGDCCQRIKIMFLSLVFAHHTINTFLLRQFYVQVKILKSYKTWFKYIYFSLSFPLSIHESGNLRKQTNIQSQQQIIQYVLNYNDWDFITYIYII